MSNRVRSVMLTICSAQHAPSDLRERRSSLTNVGGEDPAQSVKPRCSISRNPEARGTYILCRGGRPSRESSITLPSRACSRRDRSAAKEQADGGAESPPRPDDGSEIAAGQPRHETSESRQAPPSQWMSFPPWRFALHLVQLEYQHAPSGAFRSCAAIRPGDPTTSGRTLQLEVLAV